MTCDWYPFSFFSFLAKVPRRAAMRLAAAAVMLVGLAAAGAGAQTIPAYVVTTAGDDATGVAANCPPGGGGANCTLRDALAAAGASNGGHITFDPTTFASAQTVTLSSTLSIPTATTITGPGATLLTVSGNNAVRVFSVGSGVTASISGMTIAHGLVNPTQHPGLLADGGGIYNAGTLSLSSCALVSNEVTGSAPTSGGAIYNTGSLTVNLCTLSGNTVTSGNYNNGGALANAGSAVITYSTLSGNNAAGGASFGGKGGAIYNTSYLMVESSTIAGNQVSDAGAAGAEGGAIFSSGELFLGFSTISGNNETKPPYLANQGDSGGGIYSNGTCTIYNTLLAGNTDTGGFPDGEATCHTSGGNLIGNGTGISLDSTATSQVGTSDSPIDPKLAPLANYGGPTQTMIPLPGSPAICTGSAVILGNSGYLDDQRGILLNLNGSNASSYTGLGGYCPAGSVDVGAVQTDYALSFSPVSGTVGPAETGTVPNVAMSPAPQVVLTEGGGPFMVSSSISLTDGDAKLSPSPASASTSGGVATFNGLLFTGISSSDTLMATLPLNPSLAPPISLTAESASFSVDAAPTTVVTPPTASAINAGQTLASSTLSGGSVVSAVNGAAVSGTWSFVNPLTTVLNTTGPQPVIFTPSSSNYATPSVVAQVNVTVIQPAGPVAKITPSSIEFGSNIYLDSVITKTVTVANVGNAAMTISNPLLAIVKGGNSSEFLTFNLCPGRWPQARAAP